MQYFVGKSASEGKTFPSQIPVAMWPSVPVSVSPDAGSLATTRSWSGLATAWCGRPGQILVMASACRFIGRQSPGNRRIPLQPAAFCGRPFFFSEVEFQAAADGARRGVLDWSLIAFFRDLVAAIRNIGDIEFQIQAPRLSVPQIHAGSQVCGEVLR